MNTYKFSNGYKAYWNNKAINPESVNTMQFEWTPKPPDVLELGNQFFGEYMYSFIPRVYQPIANRMNEVIPYIMPLPIGDALLQIDFIPNERPKYKEMYYPMNMQQSWN